MNTPKDLKEEMVKPVLKVDKFNINMIPICCREGHPNCPHVPKREKKIKTNVGL